MIQDDYTMHLGDVGINAAMVENFEKEEGRGWAAYAKHFVSAVNSASLFDVTIEIDNKIYEHKAYSVLIANTRMYGTGAIVNPMGNPHDGIFEIVLLTKRDWSGVINLGLTAFDKRAVETFKEYTKNYSAKSARIKFDKPRMLQLDGEVIGECDFVEAEIIPGGAKYITTGDNHFIDQLKSP
jgi:diacylglycerol kinase family enzyme